MVTLCYSLPSYTETHVHHASYAQTCTLPGGKLVTAMEAVITRLNAELNPIRHLLALVGAHHIVHVSRVGVNSYRDIQIRIV